MRMESQFRNSLFSIFLTGCVATLSGACTSKSVSSNSAAEAQVPVAPVESLTRDLMNLNASHADTDLIIEKAKARRDALNEALQTDPSAVLKVAFSKDIRNSMPSEAREYLEDHLAENIEGTLLILATDDPNGGSGLRHKFVTPDGKLHDLFLVHAPQSQPLTGTRVKLRNPVSVPKQDSQEGAAPEGTAPLVATSAEETTPILSRMTTLPNTFGLKKVLIMLLNFQDQPTVQPWTADQVKAEMITKYNSYVDEASFHQASITGDVVGYYTIGVSSTASCDSSTNTIVNLGNQAASSAGVSISNYDRVVYMFPKMSNCAWAGLAYIGAANGYNQVWINGYNSIQVGGHELGHSYGLYHANAYSCGGTSPIGANCTNNEYADPIDLMGNRSTGHYNAFHKEQLRWLNYGVSPAITTVTSSGTYTIDPYETNAQASKALKIAKGPNSSGGTDYYYIEYRQPIGFDSTISSSGTLLRGLSITQANDTNANSSHFLDMAPSTSSFLDGALALSQTFQDLNATGGGVSISLNSSNSSGAAVHVSIGGSAPTCVRANPTLAFNPSTTQWVTAGGGYSYTLSITNRDSSACGSSTFNLGATPQAGISASFSSTSVVIASGATSNVTLQLTSASTNGNGTYSASIAATNSSATSYVGTASATLGVQAACTFGNPTVTITPASTSINAGSGIAYSVSVRNNNSAGCGASSFNVAGQVLNVSSAVSTSFGIQAQPNVLSLNPGQTGTSTLQVTSASNTAAGTYQVSATASNTTGGSVGVATASLTVNAVSSCVTKDPITGLLPSSFSVKAGASAVLNLSATNTDSAGCASAKFALYLWILSPSGTWGPAGVSGQFAANPLPAVAPGATGNSTLTVVTSSGIPLGNYQVWIAAQDLLSGKYTYARSYMTVQ